jgi:hypothetical protein
MESGPGLNFVDRFGDDAGEALFMAGIAMIEQAVNRAREGVYGRWRYFPGGEVRKLRQQIARGLRLVHEAQLLQDHVNDELRALTQPIDELLADRAREKRRAGTREAERVRLANAAARRAAADA